MNIDQVIVLLNKVYNTMDDKDPKWEYMIEYLNV